MLKELFDAIAPLGTMVMAMIQAYWKQIIIGMIIVLLYIVGMFIRQVL